MLWRSFLYSSFLGWVVCTNTACQEYADPRWVPSALPYVDHQTSNTIKWAEGSVTIGSGRRGYSVLRKEFIGKGAGTTVTTDVNKYKTSAESYIYYKNISDWSDDTGFQVYKRGEVNGLRYCVSRAYRPRSDPEGGGGYQDERITNVILCKNLTVVTSTIYTEGANRQVDVTQIVRSIDSLVKDW